MFYGTQAKPVLACYFRNDEQREKSIKVAFENRRAYLARKTEYRKERTSWVPTYKVGDIFRTCWGYDQTNVEYFEIVEIKGKHAILRELAQERTQTGHMSGNCVPLPGQYLKPRYEGDDAGQPIRRLMQKGGIKIDDVRTGWLCEGKTIAGVKVIQPVCWTAYH